MGDCCVSACIAGVSPAEARTGPGAEAACSILLNIYQRLRGGSGSILSWNFQLFWGLRPQAPGAWRHFGNMSYMGFALRPAVPGDIPALSALIERSVRGLQKSDYSADQIEAALETVFGVDSQLIADKTYFVVTPPNHPERIVGCGGWSRRRTLFGGDRWAQREDSLLDPRRDAAKIRAFFVDPDWSRRGI